MNPEVITPIVACEVLKKNKPQLLNAERKRTQESSSSMTPAKRARKHLAREKSPEFELTTTFPYFKQVEEEHIEQEDNLNSWINDEIRSLDVHSEHFLHNLNAIMSERTARTPRMRRFKQKMILLVIKNLLKMEKFTIGHPRSSIKCRFLLLLTTAINPSFKRLVARYITDKIETRLELGLDWLAREYTISREFYGDPLESRGNITYNKLFCMLSTAVCKSNDDKRKELMTQLYTDVPMVPDEAVECWKTIIPDERGLAVLELLRDLIMEKPRRLNKFINVFLHYSKHEISIIRKTSTAMAMEFFNNPTFNQVITTFALHHIEYLRLMTPPSDLFSEDQGRKNEEIEWTDSSVKACLAVYIGLLEKHTYFIRELEQLFPHMCPNVQKLVMKNIIVSIRTLRIATPILDTYTQQCLNTN